MEAPLRQDNVPMIGRSERPTPTRRGARPAAWSPTEDVVALVLEYEPSSEWGRFGSVERDDLSLQVRARDDGNVPTVGCAVEVQFAKSVVQGPWALWRPTVRIDQGTVESCVWGLARELATSPGRHVVRLALVGRTADAATRSGWARWLWLGTWFDALLAGDEVGVHEAAIEIADGQVVRLRYGPPVTVGATPKVKVGVGPRQEPD